MMALEIVMTQMKTTGKKYPLFAIASVKVKRFSAVALQASEKNFILTGEAPGYCDFNWWRWNVAIGLSQV